MNEFYLLLNKMYPFKNIKMINKLLERQIRKTFNRLEKKAKS